MQTQQVSHLVFENIQATMPTLGGNKIEFKKLGHIIEDTDDLDEVNFWQVAMLFCGALFLCLAVVLMYGPKGRWRSYVSVLGDMDDSSSDEDPDGEELYWDKEPLLKERHFISKNGARYKVTLCSATWCKKCATHGLKWKKPKWCKKHAMDEDEAVEVVGKKRCKVVWKGKKCEARAVYGNAVGKPLWCADHRKKGTFHSYLCTKPIYADKGIEYPKDWGRAPFQENNTASVAV